MASPDSVARHTGPSDQRITRAICALLYLSEAYADTIWHNLVARPQRAWGRAPGMDMTAVLRHARVVRKIAAVRGSALVLILLCVPVLFAYRLVDRHGVMVLLPVAAIAVSGWLLLCAVRARPFVSVLYAASLLMSTLVAFALSTRPANLVGDVATLAAGALSAWLVVFVDTCLSISRARRVWRTEADPADLAAPLPQSIEARAAATTAINVLVYHENRARNPFVGSGPRLGRWTVPIAVNKGACKDDGSRREPKRFTLTELYLYLAERWSAEDAPAARCDFRLYANGSRLAFPSPLLPSRLGPPLDMVDTASLIELAENPLQGDHQRVYFCVESVAHEGALVVTSFVNARMRGDTLCFELTLTALLPLQSKIIRIVRVQPVHTVDLLFRSARVATRHSLRILLASPIRLAKRLRMARIAGKIEHAGRIAVLRGRHFDFGASCTPREEISVRSLKDLDHNVLSDLESQAAHLQRHLIDMFRTFLEDRDIDTAVFDENASAVKNIQNWSVDSISGTAVALGNNITFESPKAGYAGPQQESEGDGDR